MGNNEGTSQRDPSNSQQANVGKQSTYPQSTPGAAGAKVGAGEAESNIKMNGKLGKGF